MRATNVWFEGEGNPNPFGTYVIAFIVALVLIFVTCSLLSGG